MSVLFKLLRIGATMTPTMATLSLKLFTERFDFCKFSNSLFMIAAWWLAHGWTRKWRRAEFCYLYVTRWSILAAFCSCLIYSPTIRTSDLFDNLFGSLFGRDFG